MPLALLVAAMAAVVLASNVLVQFVVAGGLLTWGAFTYPAAFLVTDLANRLHGAAAARRVVLWGFATGVLSSLAGSQVVLATGRLRGGAWWRAPLVSSIASSALDTALFFGLAFSAAAGALFPAGATAAVAWAQEPAPLLGLGSVAPLWASLALADWGVKVALALLALWPYRLVVARAARPAR